jgi:hypothetical protein
LSNFGSPMPLLGDKYQPMGMKATCHKFMKTSGTQSKKKKKDYWGSRLEKVVEDSKICKCRNPTLAKCGGEAQHLEKLGIWSPPGLQNV